MRLLLPFFCLKDTVIPAWANYGPWILFPVHYEAFCDHVSALFFRLENTLRDIFLIVFLNIFFETTVQKSY